MMIQETLGELGFQIVGPVSTASEALSWARENRRRSSRYQSR
jgi:hypothetical protein